MASCSSVASVGTGVAVRGADFVDLHALGDGVLAISVARSELHRPWQPQGERPEKNKDVR
jgi:hypothetical protein